MHLMSSRNLMLTLQSFVTSIFYVGFVETMQVKNFSTAILKWMTDIGIKSSSSTPHEPWQNARAEVQIRVLCNIALTNMIASCLTGKFWARAIFYAADILNLQYRTDLKNVSTSEVVWNSTKCKQVSTLQSGMLVIYSSRSASR